MWTIGISGLAGRSTWCKRCGHGNVGKLSHGRHGCIQCGTARSLGGSGGCKPRSPGPCPCPFHCHHDEVVLAKAFSSPQSILSKRVVQRVWRMYEGTPLPTVSLQWRRMNSDLVAELLSVQCGCTRMDTYRYLLPALLLWDLVHPNDDNVQFQAVSVSGECVVGLTCDERQQPLKKLVVLEWCGHTNVDVNGVLLHALNELPRAKRSVCKLTAVKFCPLLVETYCKTEFAKIIRRHGKTQEELEEGARVFYCESWGLPQVPASALCEFHQTHSLTNHAPKKRQCNLDHFFRSKYVQSFCD